MTFSERAQALAGTAGAVLGWAPDQFWRATPAELAAVFAALAPASDAPADAALVARMKEQFPDG
jgi:uncharacterized phage protein (TIGR02216 family)